MNLIKGVWKVYEKLLMKNARRSKYSQSLGMGPNLVFAITSRCNFSCKHCMRNPKNPKDLPLEIAEKALKGIKKYNGKIVTLTGGEPFAYPKIKELIKMIVDNKLSFSIVTNGWLFKEYIDFLKQYKRNIAFIAFSLESTEKNFHDSLRKPGSFDRLMEDFQLCRQYKIPFRTITALTTANYDKILELGIFLKRQKPSHVVFTTMIPCPRTEQNKLVLDAEKRQEIFLTLQGLANVLKLPVVIAADIRAESNLHLCRFMKLMDISIDAESNIVHCCELAGYDFDSVAAKSKVTSLKDKSFEQGLATLSEHIHKSICARIKDYENCSDTDHIDFNSCFYCVNKFLKPIEKKI